MLFDDETSRRVDEVRIKGLRFTQVNLNYMSAAGVVKNSHHLLRVVKWMANTEDDNLTALIALI